MRKDGTEETQVKEIWKANPKTLYKRDINMITTFKEREYEREPTVKECEERGALEELENGKAPSADEIPIELFQVVLEKAIQI